MGPSGSKAEEVEKMTRGFQNYVDLVILLTQKELKVKYRNSILGYFWSIGHPLALALVFYIAFKIVMKITMEDYALFLIAGLFPWQWLNTSTGASPFIFLVNASLIKKVQFPRNIIPFTVVLQDAIHFLCSIPVVILFAFVYQKHPHLSWVYGIPLLLVIQFLLTYGLSMLVATLNLFFRDLERMTGIFMTLLFYFTPIIYPETMIPEKYQWAVNLNPVTPLMVSWRNLFLTGRLEPLMIFLSVVYSLFFLFLGYAVYKKLSWKFAEVL